jgi:uncharacterized phage protein (TIGR02218 family)
MTSSAYIAKETATLRKPCDLYRIWAGSTYWYYTSGDVPITFGGNIYQPATINRDTVQFNAALDISTVKIQFASVDAAITSYVAQNPIAIVWVEISRVFRDQSPLENSVIFIGQIKTVSFKGTTAEATCVGFEHFLHMNVPTWRFQTACNHKLFDAGCGLAAATFKLTTTVTVDATQTILTSAGFGLQSAGYYTNGWLQYGTEYRHIVAHSGTTISLKYRMSSLPTSGASVDVYPGCDGYISTCVTRFANINHFLGFPFIPMQNPALRT